jgi:hypothetical protein
MNRTISRIVKAVEVPLTPTMIVKRVFPNQSFKNLDPFVFLDHFGPTYHRLGEGGFEKGTGAHPHRGFITFTYMFEGEMEHMDSRGNHSIVTAGGGQWMKAASGIMHDEKPSQAFLEKGGYIHGLQLWINLPAQLKNDTPQYQPLEKDIVPEIILPDGSLLRVLIGKFGEAISPIPTYSPMSVFHLKIKPNSTIQLPVTEGWHLAAYIPSGAISIDNQLISTGELAVLNKIGDVLILTNNNTEIQNVMIYAGIPIGEPIITYGPFVMDTLEGVQRAYADFQTGKYGEINYS